MLYGSAAPEISGNLDDDVGEILDMCTADDEGTNSLDEREVIILRDVDDTVAKEVVEVIGNMSKEEADQMGGKALQTIGVLIFTNSTNSTILSFDLSFV